ncbi:MAG: prephenate dehydratase [Balneolaceae bacterium]
MGNDNLKEIRKKIDDLDDAIIRALSERHAIVRQVLNDKLQTSKEIRDPRREEVILETIRKKANRSGMDPYFVEQLFKEVIQHSVQYQSQALVDHQNDTAEEESIRVGYQGTDGAFSHQAAMRHFGERYKQVHCLGYKRFREAAEAVEQGEVDVALLPIENTTAGSINDTYDLLNEKELYITGEEVMKIVHCLMAPEEVDVSRIRRVLSHPQAIAQCSRFLAKLQNCHVESYFDTAMAARSVKEDGDLSKAAIASSYAAAIYGLSIIKSDIANQEENYTRFVVVSPKQISCDPQLDCKTSLIFATSDEKGSLLRCLNIIGDHGINMSKLESRPRLHHPWQSLFYLDIDGNMEDLRVKDALGKLQKKAQFVKVLGSYPKKQGRW